MKKFWKKTEGFTLVELVVVIAILGILAGVGTVGYSGYVKKANMAADEQLFRSVENAIQLAYLSDVSFVGAEAMTISKDGVTYSDEDGWLKAAMEKAFGSDVSLKLKYDGWGKGAAIMAETIEFFNGIGAESLLYPIVTGQAKPTFADDVDPLFVQIRDTAISVNTELGGESVAESGAELLKHAAVNTIDKNKGGMSAQEFVDAWGGFYWGDQLKNTTSDTTILPVQLAVANAGVKKARNTSMAIFLRENGYADLYDSFANYGGAVPGDIFAYALPQNDENYEDVVSVISAESGVSADRVEEAVWFLADSYAGTDVAKNDALAYYTMMTTVNNVNQGENDDAQYWDDMQSAVSMYGSIAQGNTAILNATDMNEFLQNSQAGSVSFNIVASTNSVTMQNSVSNVIKLK